MQNKEVRNWSQVQRKEMVSVENKTDRKTLFSENNVVRENNRHATLVAK